MYPPSFQLSKMSFDPSAPLGSISLVAVEEFNELETLTEAELQENIKTIKAEIETFEAELQKSITQQTHMAWDEARQWLVAFNQVLSSPVHRLTRQIKALKAELRETMRALRGLDDQRKSARSHDELMMVDEQESNILNRQEKIEEELDQLKAQLHEL